MEVCAGLGRDCGPAVLNPDLARAERDASLAPLLDPHRARETRASVETALQAAHADRHGSRDPAELSALESMQV